MKLSLWQQFSGNHSSSYTVVGEFISLADANAAATQIQVFIREASDWCLVHDHEYRDGSRTPTPIEQSWAERFELDWKEKIDWLTYAQRDEVVSVIDRLVVIDTGPVQTWQTGHQFVGLLSALGANKVASSVMEGKDPDDQHEVWQHFTISINAGAETEEAALSIAERLRAAFAQREPQSFVQPDEPIDWLPYHPHLINLPVEEVQKLERQYLEDAHQASQLHAQFRPQENREFHNKWAETRQLPHEQWIFIGNCRQEVRIYSGSVSQRGTKLLIRGITFAEIPVGLPAFTQYLKVLGCRSVEYTIQEDELLDS